MVIWLSPLWHFPFPRVYVFSVEKVGKPVLSKFFNCFFLSLYFLSNVS